MIRDGDSRGRDGRAHAASPEELPRQVQRRLAEAVVLPTAVEDQLDVVDALVELGLDRVAAMAAVEQDRVPLVLLDELLGASDESLTLEQMADAVGVPFSVLSEIRQAMGFAAGLGLTQDDRRWAELTASLLSQFTPESVIRATRGRATGLSAVVASDLMLLREEIVLPLRQRGVGDLTVAVALAEAAAPLEAVAREMVGIGYVQTLRHVLGSELAATIVRSRVTEVTLAVGFVDLVGYTAMSARIGQDDLQDVLDAFESRAVELVSANKEVAIVKFLGDAVMLISADPLELARVMLDFTTEVEALADSPVRGGMSHGPVLVREGDYYGSPVNTAARLTDLARTWGLLADESLDVTLGARFTTRRMRSTRLRGLPTQRPVALLGLREDVWADG